MGLSIIDFQSYEISVAEALDELDAHEKIGAKPGVLIILLRGGSSKNNAAGMARPATRAWER